MYVIATRFFFCILAPRAMPAMTGTRAPSIAMAETIPVSGVPKWRLQSLPADGDDARAMCCARMSRAVNPITSTEPMFRIRGPTMSPFESA
ncbi:MAG: hypothetical protein M3167_19180 [Acidobacteriota bacterium]|nr:hypothetical protein [Acidobacteriota bacterium]